MEKATRDKVIYHTVICAALAGSVLCGVFVFPQVWGRFADGWLDLWDSCVYYVRYIFSAFTGEELPPARVIEIPENAVSLLPWTWEEFTAGVKEAGKRLIAADNFFDYLFFVSQGLLWFSLILTFLVPIILLFFLLGKIGQKIGNTKRGDTAPLKVVRKILNVTFYPARRWLRGLAEFWGDCGYYRRLFLIVWLYNLNGLTIILEAFAYVIYFISSFDVISLYTQVAKLFMDLSVSLSSVPLWLAILAGVVVFDKWRLWHAKRVLRAHEKQDEEFIRSLGVATFVGGTMASGKTLQLTDMTYTYEKIMREEAHGGIMRNDLRFPNFPWQRFEDKIRDLMDKHLIYNKATARLFVQCNEDYFQLYKAHAEGKVDNIGWRSFTEWVLPRRSEYAEYIDKDFFGYDYKRHGTVYDDGLQGIDLFRVLEYYAEYYVVYALNCPEVISNYSIRWDYEKDDEGNFPLWDTDSFGFEMKPEKERRHSKILDFDMLRLGKAVNPAGENKDVFEFGSLAITEIGKERGNQHTMTGRADDGSVNQRNDGFNLELKLGRHPGTVEFSTFVKFFMDDQRMEDWEASGSSLCDYIHIRKSAYKTALPFFAGEELLYQLLTPLFQKWYYKRRYKRGTNDLTVFLVKGLYNLLSNYYQRRRDRYGMRVQNMEVRRQGQKDGEAPKTERYYIMTGKTYGRYRSDAYSGVFAAKAARSRRGLADVPEYSGDCATWGEYGAQNSFLIAKIAEAIVEPQAAPAAAEKRSVSAEPTAQKRKSERTK